MKYEFKAADGTVIERDFAPIDVPDSIEVDGVVYRAQFWDGGERGFGGSGVIIRDHDHKAHSAPRRWAAHDSNPGLTLGSLYDKWTDRGVAVVQGAEDKRRLQKACKTIWPRQDWRYDP